MKSGLVLLFGVVMMLTGCTVTNPPPSIIPESKAVVFKLDVDWDYIDSLSSFAGVSVLAGEQLPPATHVGVRLVLPDLPSERQGVYMESATRASVEEDGLIVMEVPQSENAYLQVVVVHRPETWKDNTHYLYYVGGIRDLRLQGGDLHSYAITDVELYDPREQWELLPPWDALSDSGELMLNGGEDYEFKFTWKDGFPLPQRRSQDSRMPWIIWNFGYWNEHGGWYDFGGVNDGVPFKAPESGNWTVGFLLWIPGSDYGLDQQSYYLPTTVRDGEHANSRWNLKFE